MNLFVKVMKIIYSTPPPTGKNYIHNAVRSLKFHSWPYTINESTNQRGVLDLDIYVS